LLYHRTNDGHVSFFVSTNEEQDLAEEDFFSLFEAVAKHIFVVIGGLFVSSPT